MGNFNQEKGGGKPWSRSWPKGSLMVASTRKKKMKTTKITTMKIMANCNQEKGGGKPWSRSRPKGSLVTASTRNKKWRPPRSRLRGLLTL
jgi:hypothetical protein